MFVPEQKTYYVIEMTAPSGYVCSDVIQKVEIDDKKDPEKLTFKNYKNTTYIEVTKVSDQDPNKKLAGAVFEIYADASCTGTPIEKMEPTDENGYSKSGTLPVSANTTFYLKEVTAPTGYKIAPVQEVAVVNQTNQTTVQDTPIPKQIKVEKIDSVTEARLAGAQFTVYTDEACTMPLMILGNPLVLETGVDGTATSEKFIYEGTVCYLKETKAPEDYLLSNKVYELTLKPGENGQAQVSSLEAAIPNDRQTAQILIKKTTEDESTPLEDAVFGIYRDETCENLWMELPATDIDGKSKSPIFTPDQTNYYVKELYAPVGYQLSDEVDTVTITSDQKEYTVVRTNDRKWTKIQVHKYDAMNNKNLSGAEFGVYENINCTAGTELDTFETNSDGYGISKKLLLTQDEFYVKELKAPAGYAKLNTVWKVTAVENAVCALLEVPNIPEENKNDLVQVEVKKVESGTAKPLAGACFTVYKDEECTQPVVEVGPTRSSGYALSPKFVKEQDTTYWVKESKAPSGYVLNDEVKTIIPGTDRYTLKATVFENQ